MSNSSDRNLAYEELAAVVLLIFGLSLFLSVLLVAQRYVSQSRASHGTRRADDLNVIKRGVRDLDRKLLHPKDGKSLEELTAEVESMRQMRRDVKAQLAALKDLVSKAERSYHSQQGSLQPTSERDSNAPTKLD